MYNDRPINPERQLREMAANSDLEEPGEEELDVLNGEQVERQCNSLDWCYGAVAESQRSPTFKIKDVPV